MFRKFILDKQVASVKANTITIEYPDDTPDELIEKDFTEWVLSQLDAGITVPRTWNCSRCGEEELIGNIEINGGLCNDCYNYENPY